MWVLATESLALCGTRPDADRSFAGRGVAPAIHLLAISGLPAFAGSQATVGPAAGAAPTRVGSSECAAGHGHAGYRHHRAHTLRPPSGRPQDLPSQEQGQEDV